MSDQAERLEELRDTLQDYARVGIAEVVVTPERIAALEAGAAALRASQGAQWHCEGDHHVFSYISVSRDEQRCVCGRVIFVVISNRHLPPAPQGSEGREPEKDHGAGLIHQPIPDMAGTEPRPNFCATCGTALGED